MLEFRVAALWIDLVRGLSAIKSHSQFFTKAAADVGLHPESGRCVRDSPV